MSIANEEVTIEEMLEAVNHFDDGALSTFLESIDVKEFRAAIKYLNARIPNKIEQFQLRFMAIHTLQLSLNNAACTAVKHDSKLLFSDLTDYVNANKA
jgi:hypothetical protein